MNAFLLQIVQRVTRQNRDRLLEETEDLLDQARSWYESMTTIEHDQARAERVKKLNEVLHTSGSYIFQMVTAKFQQLRNSFFLFQPEGRSNEENAVNSSGSSTHSESKPELQQEAQESNVKPLDFTSDDEDEAVLWGKRYLQYKVESDHTFFQFSGQIK